MTREHEREIKNMGGGQREEERGLKQVTKTERKRKESERERGRESERQK